jgi:hypothetical protein
VTKRDKKDPSVTNSLQPSRRDRFLPAELLGISAGLGVFVGLIVLIATREFILAGIALGVAFILSLVLMALFALAFKPTTAEVEDIHEQDVEAQEKAAEQARPATDGTADRSAQDGAPDDGRPTGH